MLGKVCGEPYILVGVDRWKDGLPENCRCTQLKGRIALYIYAM